MCIVQLWFSLLLSHFLGMLQIKGNTVILHIALLNTKHLSVDVTPHYMLSSWSLWTTTVTNIKYSWVRVRGMGLGVCLHLPVFWHSSNFIVVCIKLREINLFPTPTMKYKAPGLQWFSPPKLIQLYQEIGNFYIMKSLRQGWVLPGGYMWLFWNDCHRALQGKFCS
jgi:hypothetical protein